MTNIIRHNDEAYYRSMLTRDGRLNHHLYGLNYTPTFGGGYFDLWPNYDGRSVVPEGIVFSVGDKAYGSLADAAATFKQLSDNKELNDFLFFDKGRFYLDWEKIPNDGVLDDLKAITWIKSPHRMATATHHHGLTVLFHRDFRTLQDFIKESTLQVVGEIKSKPGSVCGSAFALLYEGKIEIASAKHVFKDLVNPRIRNPRTGFSLAVAVKHMSKKHDIIFLEAHGLPEAYCLDLGRPALSELNDEILVCGYPEHLGDFATLSSGHISNTDASYNGEHGLIQISGAAINPNNSGGPVLDSFGKVIGILTTRIPRRQDIQNIALAEPIDRALRDMATV